MSNTFPKQTEVKGWFQTWTLYSVESFEEFVTKSKFREIDGRKYPLRWVGASEQANKNLDAFLLKTYQFFESGNATEFHKAELTVKIQDFISDEDGIRIDREDNVNYQFFMFLEDDIKSHLTERKINMKIQKIEQA